MSPLQKIVHEYAFRKRNLLGAGSMLTSQLHGLGYHSSANIVEGIIKEAIHGIEKVYQDKRKKYEESQTKELPPCT